MREHALAVGGGEHGKIRKGKEGEGGEEDGESDFTFPTKGDLGVFCFLFLFRSSFSG